MVDIVTPSDLASFLRVSEPTVYDYQAHLALAHGLVVEVVGDQAVWSATARAVVLAAVARAYYNPEGLRSETTGGHTAVRDSGALGVYLTDGERSQLQRATVGAAVVGPLGDFPDVLVWPDPIQ